MRNSKPAYEELEKRVAQLEAARGAACPGAGEQLFSSEELQKRELRFQELVESSTDWIWEVDKNFRFCFTLKVVSSSPSMALSFLYASFISFSFSWANS